MIRIESLTMENFCQHERFTADFHPGVVGIIGSNGTGKSNLVKAIRKALLGSSGNDGVNDDDLRFGAEKGFVEVSFFAGDKGVVKRSLKSSSVSMSYGGSSYRTATAVDKRLMEILDVPARILEELVFVPQGHLEAILFQPKADRMKCFQALFGTAGTETVREALLQELTQTVAVSREELIAKLELEVKEQVTPAIDRVNKEVAELSAQKLSAEHVVQIKNSLTAYELVKQESAVLEHARERCSTLMKQITEDGEAYAKLEEEFNKYGENLMVLTGQLTVAKDYIQKAQDAESHNKARETLFAMRKTAEGRLAAPRPQLTLKESDITELKSQLTESERTLTNALHVLSAVKQGNGVCFACHQAVPESFLHRCKEESEQLGPFVDTYRKALRDLEQAYSKGTSDGAVWISQQQHAKTQIDYINDQLKALPVECSVDATKLAANRKVVEDEATTKRVYEHTHMKLTSMYERITLAMQQLKSFEDKKTTSGTKATISAKEASEFEQQLSVDYKLCMALENLKGQQRVNEDRLNVIQQQIAQHKQEQKKLTPIRKWKELLEGARAVLHYDCLPRMVTQAYLQRINVALSRYLAYFEVGFSCTVDERLGIECIFPSGYKTRAGRLSGGQKVMLAIAFRFAVHELFAGTLGLMILDEPTYFLDDDRVDSVCALLSKVKSYSKAAGMQLFVVTHEPRLTGVFDQVIQVSSRGN